MILNILVRLVLGEKISLDQNVQADPTDAVRQCVFVSSVSLNFSVCAGFQLLTKAHKPFL